MSRQAAGLLRYRGITTRKRTGQGWQVSRDIHLGQNIPGYAACHGGWSLAEVEDRLFLGTLHALLEVFFPVLRPRPTVDVRQLVFEPRAG